MRTCILTVLFIFCFGHRVQCQCTPQAINICIDAFVVTADTTRDNQGSPVLFKTGATESDFNNLCSAKNNFINCIAPFMDICEASVKHSLQGMYDAPNYMCSTKQSSDYMASVPCLGDGPNLGYSTMCLSVMTSGLTNDNWCQQVNDFFGCMTKGANINCDAAAADYQHEVVLRQYQNQATNLHSCTISNRKYKCRTVAAGVCYVYFTDIAGLTRDHLGVPIPFTKNVADANVDKICTSVEGLKNCVKYDEPCSSIGIQKTIEGVVDMFDYICDNKNEYKTNSKCLAEADHSVEADTCTKEVNAGLSDANWCRKVDTYYKCLDEGANKHCSPSEAEYQTKIYQTMLGQQAERYTCGTAGMSAFVGSGTMIVTILLIIFQIVD